MKKVLSLVLALVVLVALFAGCAKTETPSSSEADTSSTVSDTTSSDASSDATSSDATSSDAADDVKVMTYAEYDAAAIDDKVVIEAYVQDSQGWWEKDGKGVITVYAQDKDGAYFLYEMACSEEDSKKLTAGTKIQVTGYKAEWSGEVEIVDGTFTFVEGADAYVAEALDVTDLLASDDLVKKQNMFVSFKGMTVEPSTDADGNEAAYLYSWDGSGSQGDDLYFNVSVNGATYNFTVESYLRGSDSDVYKAVEALKVGDKIDLEGFLYWYNGVNPHIVTVTAAAE